MNRYLLPSLILTGTLAGCATSLPQPAQPVSAPVASTPAEAIILPPAEIEAPTPPVVVPTPTAPKPVVITEQQGRQILDKTLPPRIADRKGWSTDIFNAFKYLKLPYTRENFCAVNAVIEQESSWQSDPGVPNLPAIVWGKIAEKAHRYLIPLPVVKAGLMKTSPNGKSYKDRIDHLRTEREMNDLFEDMNSEAKKLGLPAEKSNPIRTGGPMQVSVEFATAHVQVWPYPYPRRSIRQEVFTRRGGVYFGSAILLQYPAPYTQMLYRFADFNAGRYSSRNAAFQAAVEKLGGRRLSLDGDLLSYQNGRPAASTTEQALLALAGRLGMSSGEIQRDLKLEKFAGFSQTTLYRKVFALADQRLGRPAPRAILPQIDLKSPKITRKLTTEWFAKRVDGRWQACMQR